MKRVFILSENIISVLLSRQPGKEEVYFAENNYEKRIKRRMEEFIIQQISGGDKQKISNNDCRITEDPEKAPCLGVLPLEVHHIVFFVILVEQAADGNGGAAVRFDRFVKD